MAQLDDGEWQEFRDDILEAIRTFDDDLAPENPETLALLEEGGFWEDMRNEDLMGVLLRGHLWCQQALTRVLKLGSSFPEYVPDRLNFATTLQLAASTGFLAQELVPPLKVLNKIRNRVAHELGAMPGVDDERQLQDALPDSLAMGAVKRGELFPVPFITAITGLVVVTTRCAVATRQLREEFLGESGEE